MGTESAGTPSESWRIVVFSVLPDGLFCDFVKQAAESLGHRLVAVVTSPGPKRRRNTDYQSVVAWADPNIDVLVSNHPSRWADIVAAWSPDLIVSGGFPWLIPDDVVATARLGGFNVHPSLLPRHRGPSPIEWALRSGDAEFGLTAHRIDNSFDGGNIIAQHRLPIDENDGAMDLLGKLAENAMPLLLESMEAVARGDEGVPEDESLATYAGLVPQEEREVDWRQPAREIHNQVRGWAVFRDIADGAWAEIDGERILVAHTRLVAEDRDTPQGAPGSVLLRNDSHLIVQCGDGPLEIVEWVVASA